MKNTIRKIRSDNKLSRLPPAAQNALLEAAGAGASLAELRARLRNEHGLTISTSALSVWIRAERGRRRLEESVNVAESIAKAARAANAGTEIDDALTAMIKQLALDAALAADDPKQIKMLFDAVVKKQRADLDERKLALAEARAKQADAAESVAKDKRMTPEQRDAELRRIFNVK